MTTHVDLLMDRFRAVYGIGKITPELFVEFEVVLADMPAALVHAAGDEWIGRSKWPPTPAEVADIVRRLEAEASPYEPEPEHWRLHAYSCRVCHDTGYVTVWHPETMKAAVEFHAGDRPKDRLRLATCDVPCSCVIGVQKPTPRGKRRGRQDEIPAEPLRFRSPPMVRVDPAMPTEVQVETLLEAAHTWKPARPANYEPAFEAWDGRQAEE